MALIGLKAVHVVGATDAPGTQKFQQVDLHGGLHKYKVVIRHAKARKRSKCQNVTLGFSASECFKAASIDYSLRTPVHVGGLEPLSTGKLHHHLGLLNGVRFI